MITESKRRAVRHATAKLARIIAREPLVRELGNDATDGRGFASIDGADGRAG